MVPRAPECPPLASSVPYINKMAKIGIVYEPAMTNTAESFAQRLRKKGDEVQFICRDSFPIADAMYSFLSILSSKFEETFIIISGRADSILSTWISKELLIQQSLGHFSNVHPTFAKVDDIQPWWTNQKDIIVLSLF